MSAPTNSRKTPHRNDPMTDVILATVAEATAGLRFKLADAERQRDEARECLADMVDMNESLLKSIAEYSKDPRILAMPSPRLIKAHALFTPKPTP